MTSPLITIAVLSYKNLEYLNECLDSIFSQTYENIELIISNDGAESFDEAVVKSYAEQHRTSCFSNIIVNKNPCNVGTVKHCNIVLGLANGEYMMFIACDDTFNNPGVVRSLAEGFELVPSDAMSIVCQTEMRNDDLSVCMELYVKKETQKHINRLSPRELYAKHLTSSSVFPPASRIYKMDAFKIYGGFDETYFLIEDWTSSMSYARQGMKTYYLDITGVNHRDGGVSSAASDKKGFAHRMYMLDIIRGYENVLSDHLVPPNVSDTVNTKRNWWLMQFCKIWGSRYTIEMQESVNIGEYIANYWDALT